MTAEDVADLEAKLSDPIWRLTSGELYKITPADGTGGLQPFIPRPEQVEVIRAIYERGAKQILIPKARRIGFSTVLGVIVADCLLFRKSWHGSLVDQNAADAEKKLDRVVKVALENIPDWLKGLVAFPKMNNSEVKADVGGTGESSFTAGMNARGSSNDLLWISEWGVIQAEDPKRSAKIRSGALPSARHGVIVVETTWSGGQDGDVWELLKPTLTGEADDWLVMFFPWFVDPRNVSETAVIDRETTEYFAKIAPRLQAAGIVLSEQQRRWWAAERRSQGIFMSRENPTFLDECWTSPVKGAVYAAAVERARAEGRICAFPVDGSSLVNTSWDLGAPQNTTVWYWQIVGREIRVIDCDRNFEGTLAERLAFMLAKGYALGKHYLPHDCQQTERSGATMATELSKVGFKNLVAVPRIPDVWVGINHALELFPSVAFRIPQCESGLKALSAYRTRLEGEGALTTDKPVHDWASHPADGFRVMAEAHRAGLVAFKHTTAEVAPERRARRGIKPTRHMW